MSPVTDLSFRLVDLPCYHVAMARSYGTSPEFGAWSTLLEWAERRGIDPTSGDHRFFGFNDPSPSAPDEPYGYQQWMTVPPGVYADPHEDVSIGEFEGGRYATGRCEGLETITERWQCLFEFATDCGLEIRDHPGLEELVTSPAVEPADFVFDLYLPIVNN
jgi:AraC family transcriptional regulator